MPTLSLRNARRVFSGPPDVVAVSDVSVTIHQGEFVAIEGESGSGKSTLTNLLGMLDELTSGSYSADDTDLTHPPRSEAARLRSDTFAYVFQAFHLLDRRPVVDSVELPLHYRGISAQEREERAREALEAVGIAQLAQTPGRLLSGGQRQRVAVARALASAAPVVIADEPTGNLDSENTTLVVDSIRRLHASGATVILVTHSERVAAEASRRIRLSDGRITEDETRVESVRLEVQPEPPGESSRVRFRDMVRDAWRNVSSRKGRMIGQVLAIAVAAGLVVSTLGLAFTADQQVADIFDAAASKDVTIDLPEDVPQERFDQSLDLLAKAPGVARVALGTEFSIAVRGLAERAGGFAPVMLMNGDIVSASRLTVRWRLGASQDSLQPGEVLVGETLAKQLQLPPIDTSPSIIVGGRSMVVAGIMTSTPRQPNLLGGLIISQLPKDIEISNGQRRVFLLTDTGAAKRVAKDAPLIVDPFGPQQLVVTAPTDPASMKAAVAASVQASLAVLLVVGILAGIVTVVLTTLAAVSERRHEIGLRRAVGARARHILGMLVSETLLLGMVGAAVGIFAGLFVVLAVTIVRRWTPVMDPMHAAIAFAAAVVIALIGAACGATRALRISPADALRS